MRQEDDIFVRCLRGIGGEQPVSLVASRPNRGALAGFKERTVVEYSQVMRQGVLEPAGSYTLPDSVHGLIGALAAHQTLLGDAIATEDPAMLAQAPLAYPVRPYSKAARALTRDLPEVNAEEIPPALRSTKDYL